MRVRRRALAVVACSAVVAGCGAASSEDAGAPRVVRVTVAGDGLVPEVATGVAAGDGRVVTVAHALAGGHSVTVAGRRARVLRVDRRLDLAVLGVPGLRAPAMRLGRGGRRASVGVIRNGGSQSLAASVRRRVLVHWREQPADPPVDRPGLEVAADIDPGDSGAPVLDRRRRVLGVVYARSSDRDGTAWAVDAAAVRRVLER